MRKIIVIGESVLDTVFSGSQPVKAMVGGRIANAAAIAADLGAQCHFVSECCTDRVGDLIMGYLTRHHVDVSAVDRYTTGSTALSLIFDNGTAMVNYGVYPSTRFDVVWPRIDKDDILIFGSLYAVERAQRERLYELVSYAAERHAIILYLPGFQHGINYRITHVMPAILENLEASHLVIAHDRDLHDIFPNESAQEAFHNHVEFYCRNYLHLHRDKSVTRYAAGGMVTDYPDQGMATSSNNALGWQAGFTAAVACEFLRLGVTHDTVDTLPADTWQQVIDTAQQVALLCAMGDNCVDPQYAQAYGKRLAAALATPLDAEQ